MPREFKDEFRAGVESGSLVGDSRQRFLRFVRFGVAIAVAVFSPVAWWLRIVLFFAVLFAVGLVVSFREMRRERTSIVSADMETAHVSSKLGCLQAIVTVVAFGGAIFSPVVWWKRILIFFGVVLLDGFIIAVVEMRRDRQ